MHAVRQIVSVVVIAWGVLFSCAVNQARAETAEQYYRDVIQRSQTVVIAAYVKRPDGVTLQVKYGWGKEFTTLEYVYGAGVIKSTEDQLIFIANNGRRGVQIIVQIPYSQAQVAYKLLGSPEWGITPDGMIAYYSDKPTK
jgi:hypothetical protein